MPQPLSDDEFNHYFGGGFRATPQQVGRSGLFGAAVDDTAALALGVGEAAGLPLGGVRRGLQSQADATRERYFRETGAPRNFSDTNGVGDIAAWGVNTAIGSIPAMTAIAGAGLVSGPTGALAVGSAYGVGDVLANQREQSGETNLAAALPLGVAYGAVDSLSGVGGMLARRAAGTGVRALDRAGVNMLDGLTGAKGGAARAGAQLVKTGAVEAGGETFQEGMNQLGRMAVDPGETFYNDRSAEAFKESAIGGGFLGGLMGAGAGGWRRSAGFREHEQRDLLARAESDRHEQEQLQQLGLQRERVSQQRDERLAAFFPEAEDQAAMQQRRKAYMQQFGEAAGAPSGEYVSDPDTGIERQLDMGQRFASQFPAPPEAPSQQTMHPAVEAAKAQREQEANAQAQVQQQEAAKQDALRSMFGKYGEPVTTQLGSSQQMHTWLGVPHYTPVQARAAVDKQAAIEDKRLNEYGAAPGLADEAEGLYAKAFREQQAERARNINDATDPKAQAKPVTPALFKGKDFSRLVEGAQSAEEIAARVRVEVLTENAKGDAAAKGDKVSLLQKFHEGLTGAPVELAPAPNPPAATPATQATKQPAQSVTADQGAGAPQQTQVAPSGAVQAPAKSSVARVRKDAAQVNDARKAAAAEAAQAAVKARPEVVVAEDETVGGVPVQKVAYVDPKLEAKASAEDDLRTPEEINTHIRKLLSASMEGTRHFASYEAFKKRLMLVSGFEVDTSDDGAQVLRQVNNPLTLSEVADREGVSRAAVSKQFLGYGVSDATIAKLTYNDEDAEAETAVDDEHSATSDSASDLTVNPDKAVEGTNLVAHSSLAKAAGDNIIEVGGAAMTPEQRRAEKEAAALLKAAPKEKEAPPTAQDDAFAEKRLKAARAGRVAEIGRWFMTEGANSEADWNIHKSSGVPLFADLTPEQQFEWVEALFNLDGRQLNDPDTVNRTQRQHERANFTGAKVQVDPGSESGLGESAGSESRVSGSDRAVGADSDATRPAPTIVKKPRPKVVRDAQGRKITAEPTPKPTDTQVLNDIGITPRTAYHGYEKVDVPHVKAAQNLSKLVESVRNGEMSQGRFMLEVEMLTSRMSEVSEAKAANRMMTPRVRGADIVREKLLASRRGGDLSHETVEFAMWVLQHNPQFATDLGISISKPGEGTPAGNYTALTRVMRLFKGADNTTTAVHEILHHTERMMPVPVQQALTKQWRRDFVKAAKTASPAQRVAMMQMLEAMAGDRVAQQKFTDAFKDGVLDYDTHYQLANPSEYWAVNATRIMDARFRASNSWAQDAYVWLKELIQKVKGLLGLSSDAPVLAALNEIMRGDGQFKSRTMLTSSPFLADIPRNTTTKQVAEAATRIMGRSGAIAIDSGAHTVKKLAASLQSLHDLVDEVTATSLPNGKARPIPEGKVILPSARTWYTSLMETQATRKRLEADAEKIAVDVGKLKTPDNVNQFVSMSTFEQKWGYGPKADPGMAVLFGKLLPAEQSVVKAIFAHGEKMLEARRKVLDSLGIKGVFTTGAGSTGPYAPLRRFGNFVGVLKSSALVAAENANTKAGDAEAERLKGDPKHFVVTYFDSMGLAQQFAKDNASRYAQTSAFEKSVRVGEERPMNVELLQRVLSAVKMADTGKSEEETDAVRNARNELTKMVKDMYFQSIDEHHARTSGLHRKNRAGYDTNMVRSFLSHARAEAGFLANLEHGGQTNSAFYSMQREARGSGAGGWAGQDKFNALAAHYAGSFKYEETPLQDAAMALTSAMQLATSVGYHVTNLMQGVMVTIPKLASDFNNYTGAWDQLIKGYGVLKTAGWYGNFDLAKVEDANLRAALQKAMDAGILDVGIEEDLGRFDRTTTGIGAVDKTTGVAASALHKLRYMSRAVETANRVAAAAAGYNMSMQAHGDVAKAQDYAIRTLQTTQGDFSRMGSPLLLKKLPKLVTQYKKYQFMMAALYVKAARQIRWGSPEERAIGWRMLAFKLAHTSVAAGVLGLPLANLAGMVLPAVFGAEGEPPDLERSLREMIGDEGLATLLLHGPAAYLGLDMSAKLGDDKIFSIMPYGEWDISSSTGLRNTAASLAGPAFGQLSKMADGVDAMKQDYYRGVEKLMPKGVSDAMKAFRVANEGYSLKNGDVMYRPEDINRLWLALDALGMPSSEMKRMDWMRGQQYEIGKFYADRTKAIENAYAKAVADRDTDAARELRQEWTELQGGKDHMRHYFGDSHEELRKQPLSTLLRYPKTRADNEARLQRAAK